MSTENGNGMRVKMALRLFCFALVLVLVGSIGASLVQTSFGKVSVTDFKIPTGEGKWLTGTVFRPDSASEENKCPAVITCHGYLNNSEMQDINAIELSKRGIAVIAFDAYYHGGSSEAALPMMEDVQAEGIGMVPMVEYASTALDYVDTDRIGVLGHSMGGMAVWCTMMYYGGQYYQALEDASGEDSDGGTEITEAEFMEAEKLNKVQAGLPTGFIQFSTPEIFQTIHAIVGINYARYDEGASALVNGNGDLSGDCPESLAAINSIMDEKEQVTSAEIGKYYGAVEDKTMRVLYNPSDIHPGLHFSKASASYTVDFFEKSFGMKNTIPSDKQTWFLKEMFNLIGMIGALMAIIPMAVLLLQVPVFAGLRGNAPKTLVKLESGKRKWFFWGGWALSWMISGVSFFPISKLDAVFFPGQTAFGSSAWFAQPSTNFIMLWAVFNGLIGLALFFISKYIYGKERDISEEMSGLRIGGREILKTIALAVCVFVGFYSLVFVSEYLFHIDFRFWVLGICTFTPDKLLVMLQYLPFYFVYYLAMSISCNILLRAEGQKEWLNILLCGLGNILGIVIINALQYIKLFSTGTALWAEDRLYPMVVLPLIVLLFVAAYISRSLYKATGKVWLGAMVNTLIILMIGVANTATLGV